MFALRFHLHCTPGSAVSGDPRKIEFKAITTAQRLPYVQQGRVDVVADAVTIRCDRLKDVAFSTVYYDAGQRILVPKASSARGIGDLGHKRVCATVGSTALQNIAASRSHPIPYPVAQRTDCLVALQEGRSRPRRLEVGEGVLQGVHRTGLRRG